MRTNKELHKARKEKNDEFYTLLTHFFPTKESEQRSEET